jgi:hypothetical protein
MGSGFIPRQVSFEKRNEETLRKKLELNLRQEKFRFLPKTLRLQIH